MIEAFDIRTAHIFGDGMFQQARLRYDVFVKKRQLAHPYYDGLEYDQFDTPGAVYVIWRDEQRIVRGLVRLLPTTLPYMLETFWSYLVPEQTLPKSPKIWEVTRVCVDHSVKDRRQILPELFSGVQELGQRIGIDSYICVTRPHIITHVLRHGLRQLGPVQEVEGELEAAFEVEQADMLPSLYCLKNGPQRPVLQTAIGAQDREAA
jgi:acyl homoserine lactone synthase